MAALNDMSMFRSGHYQTKCALLAGGARRRSSRSSLTERIMQQHLQQAPTGDKAGRERPRPNSHRHPCCLACRADLSSIRSAYNDCVRPLRTISVSISAS